MRESKMSKNKLRVNRVGLMILLVLAACTPAIAQHASGLGGTFNDPAGGMITKTIVERGARRRVEKKPRGGPAGNGAPPLFSSTCTPPKTREVANLIDDRNAQLFT